MDCIALGRRGKRVSNKSELGIGIPTSPQSPHHLRPRRFQQIRIRDRNPPSHLLPLESSPDVSNKSELGIGIPLRLRRPLHRPRSRFQQIRIRDRNPLTIAGSFVCRRAGVSNKSELGIGIPMGCLSPTRDTIVFPTNPN